MSQRNELPAKIRDLIFEIDDKLSEEITKVHELRIKILSSLFQDISLAVKFPEQISDVGLLLENYRDGIKNKDDLLNEMAEMAKDAKDYLVGKATIDDVKLVSEAITTNVKKHSLEFLVKTLRGGHFFTNEQIKSTRLDAFATELQKVKDHYQSEKIILDKFNREISQIWESYRTQFSKDPLEEYQKMIIEINREMEIHTNSFMNNKVNLLEYQKQMLKVLQEKKNHYCSNTRMGTCMVKFIDKYRPLFSVDTLNRPGLKNG